jgi:hypothetical protein
LQSPWSVPPEKLGLQAWATGAWPYFLFSLPKQYHVATFA